MRKRDWMGLAISIGLLFFLVYLAFACPKGSEPYGDVCVLDLKPETAPTVKPDDVQAPQTHNDPWKAEGVQVYDAPNTAEQDRNWDKAKADADAEGKRKAGIK